MVKWRYAIPGYSLGYAVGRFASGTAGFKSTYSKHRLANIDGVAGVEHGASGDHFYILRYVFKVSTYSSNAFLSSVVIEHTVRGQLPDISFTKEIYPADESLSIWTLRFPSVDSVFSLRKTKSAFSTFIIMDITASRSCESRSGFSSFISVVWISCQVYGPEQSS